MSINGNWNTRISRRTLLRTGGSAAAGIVLLGHAAAAKAAPPFAAYPFTLGVASGDPTPDGIVLWTRLAPKPLEGGGLPPEVFGVRYEVAADEEFRQIVRRGAIEALPEEVHTVHAEIGGLQPATTYWYRFKWGTADSPIGRTRTAPAAGATAAMRFAYASCQNFTHGRYGAYWDMARQDLDLVVHLGDYIYEGPGLPGERAHLPAGQLFTLNDYRTRHAQYKTDPDLQEAHAAFPWLMTWDDHEFWNNYANLDLDPDRPLDTVAERRAAAYLAYWEHAPLARSRKPVGENMQLYRRVSWGALATFHVLDTRQHRSDQIQECPIAQQTASGYCEAALEPSRAILGEGQRDWLFDGLAAQGQQGWNVLANQVGFAPFYRVEDGGRRYSLDAWDGYPKDRQRVLDFLQQNRLRNMVVITGDAHVNSVRNVPPSFESRGGDPVATEFIGTSISTDRNPNPPRTRLRDDPVNPQLIWQNNQRGYVRVELDGASWKTEFRIVPDVNVTGVPATPLATFMVEHGKPGAQGPISVVPPV
jgi:alkaline phosphatase D